MTSINHHLDETNQGFALDFETHFRDGRSAFTTLTVKARDFRMVLFNVTASTLLSEMTRLIGLLQQGIGIEPEFNEETGQASLWVSTADKYPEDLNG